jgi:hypothetical protein
MALATHARVVPVGLEFVVLHADGLASLSQINALQAADRGRATILAHHPRCPPTICYRHSPWCATQAWETILLSIMDPQKLAREQIPAAAAARMASPMVVLMPVILLLAWLRCAFKQE